MEDILNKLDTLSLRELANIDLSKLNLKTNNQNMMYDINQPAGVEHYRLMCLMSTWFDNTTLYELGTWIGAGTICMAYNKTNKVVSYDINYIVDLERQPNMEFRVGDFSTDKELLKSPFLFIDVTHDGLLENKIYQYLIDNDYKGLTVWDDIDLNPEMREFWKNVRHDKRDITKYGHYSGTGAIIFK
jgi:hypothetical protein